MKTRLIVNADDFGLHVGINAGIVEAHRHGIVTSASLAPTGAAFDDAVALARATPTLAVGVHLTLVGEAPLLAPSELPSLAPAGRLPAYFTHLFARLLWRGIPEAEVEKELLAQVARVKDAGIEVSHLDSHQHVHLHPALLPVVQRVAARFGIGAVRAARPSSPWSGIRPAFLALFARRASASLGARGLRSADACCGLAETGRLDSESLRRVLRTLPLGTSELVCHPGVGGEAISRDYAWGFRWDDETRALTQPGLRGELESRGVALITYRDL